MPCHAKRERSWRKKSKHTRHDGVRKLLTSLIGKVYTNFEVEAQLQPLDNERFNLRSAVTSPEARLDFKAGGFWSRGVTAFCDVRVTHVNSKCKQGKATSTIFKDQEKEKKPKYQQRDGIFHPFSFWNQRWDGSRLQLLSQTPSREALRKEWGTLSHYYYLD